MIVITGGSGFIGTNVICHLINHGLSFVNLDINPPKIIEHSKYWVRCNINSYSDIENALFNLPIDSVLHLAARTDLKGSSFGSYRTNVLGLSNVLKFIIRNFPSARVSCASSMLVCHVGYIPHDSYDRKPTTLYGLSKSMGESIVNKYQKLGYDFRVFRPTSIWGPWFGEPYYYFFKSVLAGKYFLMSLNNYKTFGYVGNSVQQILAFHFSHSVQNNLVYFIGDQVPLNADVWAVKIANIAAVRKPIKIPRMIIFCAAVFGSVLASIGMYFPITYFRYKNLVTSNVVDLQPTLSISGPPLYSVDEAVALTVNWLKSR